MRGTLLISVWILLILQNFISPTTVPTGRSNTFTSTYQTMTTTMPVYPSTTTYRPTNTERTTANATYLTSNWYQLSSKPNTNAPQSSTSTPMYPHDSTYQTTAPTPWPIRSTPSTSAYPHDTTYRTTRPYQWETTTTPSTSAYPHDTTYPTTRPYQWETTTTPSTPAYPHDTTYRTTRPYQWETTTTPSTPAYPHDTTYPTTRPYHWETTTTPSTPAYPHDTTYPTTRPYQWETTTGPTEPYPWERFEKTIIVEPFKNIMIRLAKYVILRSTTNSNDYQVKLSCPTNMFDFMVAESHNDTLMITSPNNCNVEIQGYQFERLDIGAVQSVTTANHLNGDRLSIITGNAAAINLDSINYDSVNVMIFGSSDVSLNGTTRLLDVTQLGAGNFDGRGLISDTGRVFSRNTGLIQIKATNALSLFVYELGNVIWCSPQIDIKTDGLNWSNQPNVRQHCD